MAKYAVDFNPDTGVLKSINWDNHTSENDKIVIEQHSRVKNAIYEENARLRNEGVNTKNSLGLLGSIPIEDYMQIYKDFPELRTMKGSEKRFFWREFFKERENMKYRANDKVLDTRVRIN